MDMTYEKLDFIFPFVVLAYGVMMTVVMTHPTLVKLSEDRMPEAVHKQLQAHRVLGFVCLLIGSLWSLQNLWL